MHRRANDVALLGCGDRGPELVVAIRLVASDTARGDHDHHLCAERIGSKQRLGGNEELSRPPPGNQLALGKLSRVLSNRAVALGAVGHRRHAAGEPAYALGHDECALSFDQSFDSLTHCRHQRRAVASIPWTLLQRVDSVGRVEPERGFDRLEHQGAVEYLAFDPWKHVLYERHIVHGEVAGCDC